LGLLEQVALERAQQEKSRRRPVTRDAIEQIARLLCFQNTHLRDTCGKCKSPADCRDWDASAFRYREDAKDLARVLLGHQCQWFESQRNHSGKMASIHPIWYARSLGLDLTDTAPPAQEKASE